MAFSFTTYDNQGAGLGGAPKIATYRTADNMAAVKAGNYFNDISDGLETGDLIYVEASDGTRIFSVTVNKSAGTVVLALNVVLVTIT